MAKKDIEQTVKNITTDEIKKDDIVINDIQKEEVKKEEILNNMNFKDTQLFKIAEQTDNNVIRVCNVHGGCIIQSITQIGDKLSESITFLPYVKFDGEFRQI